jgi:hypothetical protein
MSKLKTIETSLCQVYVINIKKSLLENIYEISVWLTIQKLIWFETKLNNVQVEANKCLL